MIVKFLTVLSWIIGLPCAVAFIVCVLGRIFVHESLAQQARTEAWSKGGKYNVGNL